MPKFLPNYAEIAEPRLRFHAHDSTYVSENPIQGLNRWGPYDASIPGSLRPNPLRVAILSPVQGFQSLIGFLSYLNTEVRHQGRDEYVQNWPGFRQVFQTNFEYPTKTGDALVSLISEQDAVNARRDRHPEVAFLETIKNHIQTLLRLIHNFHVLVIFIPRRWADFRERKEESYEFDLHDALKLFSAPNNIPIQIIQEDSFDNPDQARICWWLALALYVKGGGIPWKLAAPSPDTAYVGLSYGISRNRHNNRIVMGCSQVFDEHGQGLKFLLYPVEQVVYQGKNPFMSSEDARRLFSVIRDLYQGANGSRPKRVVVHKTTHFTRDEIAGIATALSGTDQIELLQIQQDTRWRAIAYEHSRQQVSNFPVKRGTVIPLDRYSFLLWTQGDMDGIAGQGRHYYQEKRGIPSPVNVKRFRGASPLEKTASEILQLTKMNWNNHQLYDRLPVTLKFSSELSQIAKQAQDVWKSSYDFRFFM